MPVASDPEDIKTLLTSSFDGFEVETARRTGFGTTVQHTKTASLPLTAKTDASTGASLQPSIAQNETDNNHYFETPFQKLLVLSLVDGGSTDLQGLLHDVNTDTTTEWESTGFPAYSETVESARFSSACGA